MPGGRRRRRVPWFSFIPLLQLNDNNSTATTISTSTTIQGENNKYNYYKYYGIRTHMN